MTFLLIAFVWVLNLGISAWNAYAVGKMWVYAKQMGLWTRLITWCGFVMSGCGFSWCFLLPLALLSYINGWFGFDEKALVATMNLGYIVLAPAICLSGLFIWIDSLIIAWKERTFTSMAVAGWNTYAQLHNTYEVFTHLGPAFENVSEFFSHVSGGSDDDSESGNGKVIFVIVLVAVSVIAGFLVTTAIVVKTARAESKVFQTELESKMEKQNGSS
jgi:hypothetical protein